MGFSTFFTTITTDGLTNARLFIGDASPLFGLLFSVAIAGLVIAALRRFV